MQHPTVRPAIRPECEGCGRLEGQPVQVVAKDGTAQAAVLVLCQSCLDRPSMIIWRRWALA